MVGWLVVVDLLVCSLFVGWLSLVGWLWLVVVGCIAVIVWLWLVGLLWLIDWLVVVACLRLAG